MDAGSGARGAVEAVHPDVDKPEPALHPPGQRGGALEAVATKKGRRKRYGPCGGLIGGVYSTAESGIFHRTPAGHTAERKTRRKRNRGCHGLLSIPRQPSSPSPSPSPPSHRASVAPPAAMLSGLAEGRLLPLPRPPPSTHALPMAEICDFQRSRPKARTASI